MNCFDVERLAALILSENDEEKADELIDNGDLDSEFYDKYDIDLAQFDEVVNMLIDYTPILKSPIAGTLFHSFGIQHKSHFEALVKKELNKE